MNTHVLDTPKLRFVVEIDEKPDAIYVKFSVTKCVEFGDDSELVEFLQPIMEKYGQDKRPIKMHNPLTGQNAIISDEICMIDLPK